MKKDLPKPSRSLKSFILDEDAKVMDRTATKVAISASFIAINLLANTDDANAKGHKNHSNHQNNLNAPNNYETGIHAGNNPLGYEINGTEIPGKTVETWHSNHYNHTDAGGGQSGLGMIIGAVLAVAATIVTAGAGAVMFGPLLAGIGYTNLALAAGAGAVVGGGAEEIINSESREVIDAISGAPHHIPETILKILEEQED